MAGTEGFRDVAKRRRRRREQSRFSSCRQQQQPGIYDERLSPKVQNRVAGDSALCSPGLHALGEEEEEAASLLAPSATPGRLFD